MPRPKTKDELERYSIELFAKLENIVSPLSDDVFTQNGACEKWSIKDILAHLHGWHKLYLTWYQEGMADQMPEMPAPGYSWKTTPDLNEKIFETHKDLSREEVVDLLQQTHQKILSIIASHSDDELFEKKRYKWTGSTSLGSYTVSAMSSHYDWAIKHIKKFLKG